jgi:hypothetical protein
LGKGIHKSAYRGREEKNCMVENRDSETEDLEKHRAGDLLHL